MERASGRTAEAAWCVALSFTGAI